MMVRSAVEDSCISYPMVACTKAMAKAPTKLCAWTVCSSVRDLFKGAESALADDMGSFLQKGE
jgi:hypothetical protein